MAPLQVTTHFGNQQATADAVGCNQSTVSDWIRAGVIPDARQLQIEKLTRRALKAESGCLERILQKLNKKPAA